MFVESCYKVATGYEEYTKKIPSFSSFGLGYISDKLIFDSFVLVGHKADGPAQKQVVGFGRTR